MKQPQRFVQRQQRGRVVKRAAVVYLLIGSGCLLPARSSAQFVIADVIKLVFKKVINAVDLAVQKAQNKTIVLQNAEKELENAMAKLQLDGIADWVEKQRALYAEYYQELMQVKTAIGTYEKVHAVVDQQRAIVQEYQHGFALFRRDPHFGPNEVLQMYRVCSGILDQSLDNMNEVLVVVTALSTRMDDAERLRLIDAAAEKITRNRNDLTAFNQANLRLSLDRARDQNDINTTKALYGLP